MDQTSIFYLDFVQIHFIPQYMIYIFILYFILSIIHLFIFILIHSLFCCFFFHLSQYLFINLFIYLSICFTVCLFVYHHFKIGFEIHALFIQSVEKRKQQTTTKNTMAEGDGVCKDVSLWLI